MLNDSNVALFTITMQIARRSKKKKSRKHRDNNTDDSSDASDSEDSSVDEDAGRSRSRRKKAKKDKVRTVCQRQRWQIVWQIRTQYANIEISINYILLHAKFSFSDNSSSSDTTSSVSQCNRSVSSVRMFTFPTHNPFFRHNMDDGINAHTINVSIYTFVFVGVHVFCVRVFQLNAGCPICVRSKWILFDLFGATFD